MYSRQTMYVFGVLGGSSLTFDRLYFIYQHCLRNTSFFYIDVVCTFIIGLSINPFVFFRGVIDLPVIGIPRNDSRVVIVLPSVVVANLEATSLLIRFRTSQSDGVFFYTAVEGDYITLELTNGEVAATVNLGSGNVTIVTKDHVCNDKQWHTVRLERFERMVNLTVDNGTIFTGYTKGDFTGFTSESSDQKTTIHLGGTGDIHLKTKSVSRRNFTGCLQELVFNQYDVFSKLGTDRVRSAGTIVTTCPETPTPPTATTTTKPTTTTALTSEYTSPSNYVVTTVKSTLKSLRATTLASNTMPTTDPFPETTPTTDQVSTPYSVGNTKMDRNRFSRVGKVVITLPQKPSNGVIMEERHGPKEGDLTLWFILAAGVGIIAFVIVLIVMVKIHTASRRKYKIKQNKTALLNPNSGSFHRST